MTSLTPKDSAGHTPGPWTFSRWDELGDSRFYVAQADNAPYTPDYSDVATLIAETVSTEGLKIQEANARLIAAAPDLLEALEKIEALYEYDASVGDLSTRLYDAKTIALAAIARATVSTTQDSSADQQSGGKQ